MRPNADDVMFRFPGMSRFSTLNRFEIAISNRTRDDRATVTALPMVSENTFVPGPISSPGDALPNLPMLLAGREKHAASNHLATVGDERLPSQLPWSGRCVEVKPRVSVPVPEGSVPLLKNGVRNEPD